MIFEILITALLLGIIDGAAPGPCFTALAANLLKGGFKAMLPGFFWSSFFDASKALIIVLVLLLFPLSASVVYGLSFFGGVLLIYFGKQTFSISRIPIEQGGKGIVFTPFKLFCVHYSNPMGYFAWMFIYLPYMFRAKELIAWGEYYFVGLLELGWMIGTFVMLLLVAYARKWIQDEKRVHRTFEILGLLLVFFGGKLIWDCAKFFAII